MSNPFRYFNSSPEVIRLVVMMYVRYPLSLRNVEDLLAERGIDISHETVQFWWNRFGPMFAAEIRKRRVAHMRGPSGAKDEFLLAATAQNLRKQAKLVPLRRRSSPLPLPRDAGRQVCCPDLPSAPSEDEGASLRPKPSDSAHYDKRTIGFRLLAGAVSDGRDRVFFVEELTHSFLRDSPLKFGEGFVVARKVFVPHLGREGGVDCLERPLGFALEVEAIGAKHLPILRRPLPCKGAEILELSLTPRPGASRLTGLAGLDEDSRLRRRSHPSDQSGAGDLESGLPTRPPYAAS